MEYGQVQDTPLFSHPAPIYLSVRSFEHCWLFEAIFPLRSIFSPRIIFALDIFPFPLWRIGRSSEQVYSSEFWRLRWSTLALWRIFALRSILQVCSTDVLVALAEQDRYFSVRSLEHWSLVDFSSKCFERSNSSYHSSPRSLLTLQGTDVPSSSPFQSSPRSLLAKQLGTDALRSTIRKALVFAPRHYFGARQCIGNKLSVLFSQYPSSSEHIPIHFSESRLAFPAYSIILFAYLKHGHSLE
jgi:hypothetical protein